jgi:hypothetical protein
MSTAYHAKYFAFELTKRCASDSLEKLAASLADAQVDMTTPSGRGGSFRVSLPVLQGRDSRGRGRARKGDRSWDSAFPEVGGTQTQDSDHCSSESPQAVA